MNVFRLRKLRNQTSSYWLRRRTGNNPGFYFPISPFRNFFLLSLHHAYRSDSGYVVAYGLLKLFLVLTGEDMHPSRDTQRTSRKLLLLTQTDREHGLN